MIQELSKRHSEWIKYATKICGNSFDACDLVQDMYLKMHTIDKEVNSSYIYCVIKNIYLDQYRKNKVREKTIFIQEELEEQNEDIDLTIAYDEALNELKTYKQLIVNFSTKDGVNSFARDSGISRATVIRIRNEFKAILWQKVKGLEM